MAAYVFVLLSALFWAVAAQNSSDAGDCPALLQKEVKRQGPSKIPCVIHQTWRTPKIVGKHKWWTKTWRKMNPGCEYKLWTDADLEDLIWPIWGGLTKIERADVFRYLVLWDQGGYYADLDVTSLKPIEKWEVPKEANMIVGYEYGHRYTEDARIDNTLVRTEQFENWLMAAAPKSPIMFRCLQMVHDKFNWKIQNALELTGPGTFSDAVHEFLEQASKSSVTKEVSFRQSRVEYRRVSHYLSYPSETLYGTGEWKLWILAAGRVNQLPQVAVPRYASADDPSEALEPIVHHYFEGTWKPAHGGRLRT